MRFRGTGRGSGGIRFKRRLSVEWRTEEYCESAVVGAVGDLVEATAFGDPCASPARGPFEVGGVRFVGMRESEAFSLASSTGRLHEVVDGPFFADRPGEGPADPGLRALGALGAWVPNLPGGESLELEVSGLALDGEYELRLAFHDGRGRGADRMVIDPGGLAVGADGPIVVVGSFVAPTETVTVRVSTADARAPYVNAAVLRAGRRTPPATFAFTR